jgi:DNA-damage-inducible protein D
MVHDYSECVAGFETKKRLMEDGVEYWMARDLMPLLAYSAWDKFEDVIEKARVSGKSVGAPVDHHFCLTANMVAIGSGAERGKRDWFLSRAACYWVAMNADSSKPEVGHAQTYFLIQTRRQELNDKKLNEAERVRLRMRIMDNNHRLAGAAKEHGVTRFPLFQDAGYRGLYGMGLTNLKAHKRMTPAADLLDHAGPLELAANDFRITLTEHRLNRDNVKNEPDAILTHKQVGSEVRETMVRNNGVQPEDLPVEPSIKSLVNKRKRELSRAKAR